MSADINLTDELCEILATVLHFIPSEESQLATDVQEMCGRLRSLEAAPASSAMAMQAGLPYGIIDPDYARIFTKARCLAWSEGYAITMHGSFTRDLDLLAVPWADRACEPEHLVNRIEDACGLKLTGRPPSMKEHGRLAWTLRFAEFGDPRFVDLSVMPRAALQSQQSPVQASDAGRQG